MGVYKLVQTGRILEVTHYQKLLINHRGKRFGRGGNNEKDTTDEEKQENRSLVLRRAKEKVRQLLNANAWQYQKPNGQRYPPVFFTITFEQNIQDLTQANKCFNKFIKRLKTYIGDKNYKLYYLGVPELQKRKAIHYHIVFFNLPYIDKKKIQDIWKLGRTRIEQANGISSKSKIKYKDKDGKPFVNLGAYLTKYLTKDTAEFLKGRKCYLNSQGLLQPERIKDRKKAFGYVTNLNALQKLYSTSYTSDYTGNTSISHYKLY